MSSIRCDNYGCFKVVKDLVDKRLSGDLDSEMTSAVRMLESEKSLLQRHVIMFSLMIFSEVQFFYN